MNELFRMHSNESPQFYICPRVSWLQVWLCLLRDLQLRSLLECIHLCSAQTKTGACWWSTCDWSSWELYIQPALTFWLLLLKCQQCPSYCFIATLRYACTLLSHIKDCTYNAVELGSWIRSVNINLSSWFWNLLILRATDFFSYNMAPHVRVTA